MLERLNDATRNMYLKMDVARIKVVVLIRENGVNYYKRYIGGEKLDHAGEFVYLGRMFTMDGEMDGEILNVQTSVERLQARFGML